MPCPDCGSSDSIQAFINIDRDLGVEWYSSFCFGKCYSQKGDPYGDKEPPKKIVKTQEEIAYDIEVVRSCPLFEVKKPYRGIPPEYFKRWGCRLLYSEFDGRTPYAIAFPYSDYGELVGWKARPFNKKTFWAIGNTKGADPFGLERALRIGGEAIWITEGEFDAIALEYALIQYGGKRSYPVVSLTSGGGSIEQNLNYIETRVRHKFKYKITVLDADVVGRKAEVSARELWPEIVCIGKPGKAKDANDAVKSGLAYDMGRMALTYKM
jgi:hypothetical protein